jgi:hypothetical protein
MDITHNTFTKIFEGMKNFIEQVSDSLTSFDSEGRLSRLLITATLLLTTTFTVLYYWRMRNLQTYLNEMDKIMEEIKIEIERSTPSCDIRLRSESNFRTDYALEHRTYSTQYRESYSPKESLLNNAWITDLLKERDFKIGHLELPLERLPQTQVELPREISPNYVLDNMQQENITDKDTAETLKP